MTLRSVPSIASRTATRSPRTPAPPPLRAGALLLGATDRAIRMMDRFASCFHDERRADLIEHEVATLVGHRGFGIALGYEDLNDHDELRHDPLMAVLAVGGWTSRPLCRNAKSPQIRTPIRLVVGALQVLVMWFRCRGRAPPSSANEASARPNR